MSVAVVVVCRLGDEEAAAAGKKEREARSTINKILRRENRAGRLETQFCCANNERGHDVIRPGGDNNVVAALRCIRPTNKGAERK